MLSDDIITTPAFWHFSRSKTDYTVITLSEVRNIPPTAIQFQFNGRGRASHTNVTRRQGRVSVCVSQRNPYVSKSSRLLSHDENHRRQSMEVSRFGATSPLPWRRGPLRNPKSVDCPWHQSKSGSTKKEIDRETEKEVWTLCMLFLSRRTR